MSGFSCGSTRFETYTGSQWHKAPGWVNDPLEGGVHEFMSAYIPAGFVPLEVPYLQAVTQFTGGGFNSLVAVPTIMLTTPYAADLLISGNPQRVFLVAGVFPGTPGTYEPNDYDALTNQKFWVQLA